MSQLIEFVIKDPVTLKLKRSPLTLIIFVKDKILFLSTFGQ